MVCLCTSTFARATSVFKGQIFEQSKKPVSGVNIIINENKAGCATDDQGRFYIELQPGRYTILISHIGYKKIKDKIVIRSGETIQKNYTMTINYFTIGGIKVFADKKLIPGDAETKTTISSGEIEHMQASSLSDIMKLVPGQRFENPGLQEKKQLSLRQSSTDTEADQNSSLGTQIIIDDIPISNNANMQIDTKVNTGTIDRTTTNEGIDLRQIPADNIEKMEVIRGIPSAKYGDLTSGIVKVETKSENLDQRFKYKYNLRNKEFNLNGGFKLFDQYWNYNFNYANSIRDIRIDDYDYSRLAGQLSHTAHLFDNLYTLKNRIYYTRTFDEQGLREGDLLLTERYNRNYIIRYNHNSKYLISPKQKLEISYAINYNRQNSYTKKLVTADNTYISDRLTEGVQEGYFFQSDTAKLWVKGRAINQYLSMEYCNSSILFSNQHNFRTGVTFRHESNNGPGRVFDPLAPPTINTAFRDRPRSYNDIPALLISSLYMEDKIKGRIWKKYQLNLGFRLENYGKNTTFFSREHGSFFNPRFNLVIYPFENTQIRMGYGTTSKAPPLSMLYPNPLYYDVADINRYSEVDSLRLAVISTHVFSRKNPSLQGSKQIKREISIDQKIGKFGLTLTGYLNKTENGFSRSLVEPIFLYKYDYPNWQPGYKDTTGKYIRDSVSTSFSKYENSRETLSRGIEFSLRTAPLTPLAMRFRLEAAYNQTESIDNSYDYSSTYLMDNDINKEVLPFWNPVDVESENLLINYRMEFQVRKLGAWITLEAQQVVFDKDRYHGLADSLAIGYISDQGKTVSFDKQERTPDMNSTYKRIYPDYWSKEENKQNIWLFNLRVSKALSRGAEVSFFVNNFFNSHPLYQRKRTSQGTVSYTRLNPDLFFGVEFSGVINDLF
ncbi:MAG: TonB-dependent receptor [Candidatus Marinimicrobia bacterium]|nr:TonB-dependent receptor [Candidatus Neomarinimicrobiota bacterium]